MYVSVYVQGTLMSLAESAELIEMPFGVVDLSGLKELDISGGVV